MIPTGDLTGILADVIPFASPDDDLPMDNAVQLSWEAGMLHARATDRYRMACSGWHPDDEPLGEFQDDLFTKWGGGDDPWRAVLPLADAKAVVSAYKLGAKEQWVPLTVECDGTQVKVVRSRDAGYSAITMVVQSLVGEAPDIPKMLANHDRIIPVAGLAYTAKWLADFAKVRPRGPLELTFTGATKATLVTIGSRFTGAITPVHVNESETD